MKRYVRLSPPGLGAVAIWRLDDTQARWPGQLFSRSGELRAWPAEGKVRHGLWMGRGVPLDEILAVGGPGWLELQLHGGEGVQLALEGFLEEQGWALADASAPQPAPESLRAARALASARWGSLARLDQAARQILAQGRPADPERAQDLLRRLERGLALAEHGRRLRTAALVRLVGQPNAGKSTLFNALLADRRALVSPRPGTTRDSVRARLDLAGVPIVLEDTAGLDPAQPVQASVHALAPDLVIQLLRRPAEPRLSGPGVLVLLGRADEQQAGELMAVSGRTGQGVDRLLSAMGQALGVHPDPAVDEHTPLSPDLLHRIERARSRLLPH